MRRLLILLDRFHWRQFTPVFALMMGFASCAICGGDRDLNGQSVCTPFTYVSAVGLPDGPVTVSWTPAEAGYVDDYIIYITSDHGTVSYGSVDPTQTSITLPADAGVVSQTMADVDPAFTIVGSGALSHGYGQGDCEWDQTISFKKAEKKNVIHPTFTSTSVPPAPKPPVQPPAPAQPPTSTFTPQARLAGKPDKRSPTPTNTPIARLVGPIHPVAVPTCPPGYSGKPPHCIEIPR